MNAELEKRLDDIVGIGWHRLYDPSLRMGIEFHEGGRQRFFRFPTSMPHKLLNCDDESALVTDQEMRDFMKKWGGLLGKYLEGK